MITRGALMPSHLSAPQREAEHGTPRRRVPDHPRYPTQHLEVVGRDRNRDKVKKVQRLFGGKGCGFNSTFSAPANKACLRRDIFLACPSIESKIPMTNATSATVVHQGLRIT